AAFVAEPVLAGAGGSGLMTVALPGQPPAAVDFFSDMPGLGRAPDVLDFESVRLDFGPVTQELHVGRGAAAVPGALPGLAEAHRSFGSLPLDDLMAPAVRLAMDGVAASPSSVRVAEIIWPIIARDPDTARVITGGGRPRPGEHVRNPELADVLREFARLGRTPDRVIEGMLAWFGPERGGLITEDDVRAYRPRVAPPRMEAHGPWTLYTAPAPGGRLAMLILHELARAEPSSDHAAEVVRHALASRAGHAQRR